MTRCCCEQQRSLGRACGVCLAPTFALPNGGSQPPSFISPSPLCPPPPPRSTKELNNFIRISVGLPEHTDRLLAALRELA